MKTKINKNVGWLLCAALFTLHCSLFTACSDDLEALPSQKKVDGNAVVDQSSAIVMLNGIYYTYAMCGTDNYDVKSTRCANYYEAFPSDLAGCTVYYQGPYLFENHSAATFGRYADYWWQPFYATVNAANAVIEQVGEASDSWFQGNKKQEILGEAYGMRALVFYDILRYFGYSWDINSPYGIILRTSMSVTTKLSLGRSSVKETYDQILSDLDYAISNAPDTNLPCYVSKWFAKGLKARVLMMRGQGNDYSDAATICADIINNGPYALEDNYEDIFHKKGLNSSEVIFGIQPKENQSDVYEAWYYRGSAQFLPSDNFIALYENDPRLGQMFFASPTMQIGFNEDGTYYIYYEDKYAICKHLVPGVMTYNDIEESQFQMRLSEIYLLRAEALARGGNTAEAKSLLKTVMSKAGITDFTAVDTASSQIEVLQQIFNEALKNLSFECGLEHNMMLRFPESIVLKFNPFYENKTFNVFGIPTDEFKYNNALTEDDQNPGYSVS